MAAAVFERARRGTEMGAGDRGEEEKPRLMARWESVRERVRGKASRGESERMGLCRTLARKIC